MKKELLVLGFTMLTVNLFAQEKPNIIIIYTDDMGIGDLSCYNSGWTDTPNINRLANEGIKFNHYYTSAPVSSASRSGLTTGMFPAQVGINTFLHTREYNSNCEQNDFLDPNLPTIAKSLKKVGYNTAHIGKWHMGGGRDVDDAPHIPEYGFDYFITTYEGPDPDPIITASNWIWSKKDSIQRWDRTAYFVDKTLDFLSKHQNEPCFVNLWPDDMHDPWIPSYGYYSIPESWGSRDNFIAVLSQYDKQIGRLIDGIDKMGIREKTIIIFTSDNGPMPTFDGARSNGLRGSKNSLYESGINMPFIISWQGTIEEGVTNDTSVLNAVDIYPSLCSIAGTNPIKGFDYSGEDMSDVLLGKSYKTRTKDMMWDFGRNKYFFFPKRKNQKSPQLGIRRCNWKLLVNPDGTSVELYDMIKDPHETTNLATKHDSLSKELAKSVITWYNEKKVVRK